MNAVVVGCGQRGCAFIRYLDHFADIHVSGVFDIRPSRMHPYIHLHRYTDVASIRSDPNVQIVFVCTPDETHIDVAEAVARDGLVLVIEKPIVMCGEDRQRLMHLLTRYIGITVHVPMVLRYVGVFEHTRTRISRLLDQGVLPEIDVVLHMGWDHSVSYFRRWGPNRTPECFLLSKLCHDVDLVAYIGNGAISATTATGWRHVLDDARPASHTHRCGTCPADACKFRHQLGDKSYRINDGADIEDACVFRRLNQPDSYLVHVTLDNGIHGRVRYDFPTTRGGRGDRDVSIHVAGTCVLRANYRTNTLTDTHGATVVCGTYKSKRAVGHQNAELGFFKDVVKNSICHRHTLLEEAVRVQCQLMNNQPRSP